MMYDRMGLGCWAAHQLPAGRPFILEMSNDDEGYRQEIAQLKKWAES